MNHLKTTISAVLKLCRNSGYKYTYYSNKKAFDQLFVRFFIKAATAANSS